MGRKCAVPNCRTGYPTKRPIAKSVEEAASKSTPENTEKNGGQMLDIRAGNVPLQHENFAHGKSPPNLSI